jgi:hypothetical protein
VRNILQQSALRPCSVRERGAVNSKPKNVYTADSDICQDFGEGYVGGGAGVGRLGEVPVPPDWAAAAGRWGLGCRFDSWLSALIWIETGRLQ